MGWALKTIKKKVRFTRKQTEFLTDQFQKGEYSGRKSDPQEVSKTMSLARDQAGERRFQPDEVLTSQQISGFFSRLSAKKRLEANLFIRGFSKVDIASMRALSIFVKRRLIW